MGMAMACFAMVVTGPGVASAAPEDFILNPALSLTGGCTTSSVDLIPDPPVTECEAGDHPPASFSSPRAVVTDAYGNIYVASYGTNQQEGKQARIDIFDSEGFFISELKAEGAMQLAVDSKGFLYVLERPFDFIRLSRYAPTTYEPDKGEIEYSPASRTLVDGSFVPSFAGIAINPVNDHLFIHNGALLITELSAAPGNEVVSETIGEGVLEAQVGASVAVDTANNRLYASDFVSASAEGVIRIFELSAPYNLVDTIDGAETPAGDFGNQPVIAANEGNGEFFVYDGGEFAMHDVSEFTAGGEYLGSISEGIKDIGGTVQIWLDNGANSPNGALSLDGRFLFVPSHPSGVGHAFAYGPSGEAEPDIEASSFTEVSRVDAELRATINPGNLPTGYIFEYTTLQSFNEEEFSGALVAGSGQIPAGKAGIQVSAGATDLSPETTYRFRVVATNNLGTDEEEGQFTTYAATPSASACPNDPLRTGPSALLPDCRAYELVTPPDTNARSPFGLNHLGVYFPALQASPAGDRVSFQLNGGTLPGTEGTGSFGGDPYLSTRTATGWGTISTGPSGAESEALLPGSSSPDQRYSVWSTGNERGSAVIEGKTTSYVRYPDGRTELVGRGSLDTDPRAEAKLISENGGHIIFTSGGSFGPAIQLEPNAPPSGTNTVYDRTSDEVTHVVSLLPGDEIPGAGQNALYRGASLDGEGIVFSIGNKLYLRHDNDETYEVGENITFAGVAEGGGRVFYVEGGDLKAFDIEDGVVNFCTSGDVTPVNVSADGSAAYFVSPSVLGGVNPNGAEPEAGKENLYLSEEGTISFVATVTERDVEGENESEGLGLWLLQVSERMASNSPARTTPDGSALLFESRANLDSYDPEGFRQVYRYDSNANVLDCLSCNPTEAIATGEGSLQSLGDGQVDPEPLNLYNRLSNIRADGRRAFFQSEEALVPEDTDGLQDVYEWEDQGVGSCTQPDGCIYLISYGQSERIDYLFAVSDSGNDVFFRSSDLLVPADSDETPSIYDARVGGGFPEEVPVCQEGQICKETPSSPPALPAPVTPVTGSAKAPAKSKPCPKGKKKVKRHGKVRCVKKKHNSKHRKAGTTKKGAQK